MTSRLTRSMARALLAVLWYLLGCPDETGAKVTLFTLQAHRSELERALAADARDGQKES
jgi:hypothetical protein